MSDIVRDTETREESDKKTEGPLKDNAGFPREMENTQVKRFSLPHSPKPSVSNALI